MKPVLFNTEFVRAILCDRKTQTMRPIKKQPPNGCDYLIGIDTTTGEFAWSDSSNGQVMHRIKAHYTVGDILYVRETFCPNYFDDRSCAYKADYYKERLGDVVPEPKWKPSIHMPKEASRLFLEVIDVTTKRLQDLTVKEIIAEGYPHDIDWTYLPIAQQGVVFEWFQNAWDTIYPHMKVENNPWVISYNFKRIESSEDGLHARIK